uniref:Caspase-6 n=1 Tax=Oncorhynchus tshawytscha TaxID=74940 RepID=A0AAZ3SLX9_ONCTS
MDGRTHTQSHTDRWTDAPTHTQSHTDRWTDAPTHTESHRQMDGRTHTQSHTDRWTDAPTHRVTHTESHKRTNRQTDSHTHRWTDAPTHRVTQKDEQTDRWTDAPTHTFVCCVSVFNVCVCVCFPRLEELSFAVRPYDNLNRQEVLAVITMADCFLCVFLSHGENECVFARDGKLSIRDLTHTFKGDRCPSLVCKPKIFIFQACRGDKHDEPVSPIVDVVDCEVHANQLVVDVGTVHTLPAGADFLMCYSVAEGYFSHRETLNGSWYIQDLCEVLQEYGTRLEITEMMTLVNRRVSLRRVENCADRNAIGKKQVPCYTSMLTKKLYFRSKKL